MYNYRGDVFCVNPNGDEQREMAYGGFEKERGVDSRIIPTKNTTLIQTIYILQLFQ